MPNRPVLKNFLIADTVFRQDTGKWCIIGVFNGIVAARFPVLHPSLGLFLTLGDAEGDYAVRVEFRNNRDQVLGAFEGVSLKIANRLQDAHFGIQTHNLAIPAAGRYFFKLFFNQEPVLGDIPVDAVLLEAKS